MGGYDIMDIVDKYGGYSVSKKTGKFLTVEEMQELGEEFEKVRNIMTIDEFIDKHVIAIPSKDRDKYA